MAQIPVGNFGQARAPLVESARPMRIVPQAFGNQALDYVAQGTAALGEGLERLAAQRAAEEARARQIEEATRAKRDELLLGEEVAQQSEAVFARTDLDDAGKERELVGYFQSRRQAIEGTYTDPEVKGALAVNLDAMAFKATGAMQERFRAQRQSRTEGNIVETLDALNRRAVDDPEGAIAEAEALIDAAGPAAGWDAAKVATEKLRRRGSMLASNASVRLREDPRGLQADLLDETRYPGMDPRARERLLAQADRLIEQTDRERIRLTEKAERDQERAVKDAQADRAAQFRVRAMDGDVGEADLVIALERRDISLEQFNQLLTGLRTEDAGVDDPRTFVDLTRAISDGDAEERDVWSAYQDGRLSKSSAASLLDRVEQVRKAGGPLSTDVAKRARQHVDNIVGGVRGIAVTLGGEDAERLAGAIREYDERVMTGEEPWQVADSVTARYGLGSVKPRRAPRYLVGGYSAPDIDATAAATVEALTRGEITEQQAIEEDRLLEEWVQWAERGDAEERARAEAASRAKKERP